MDWNEKWKMGDFNVNGYVVSIKKLNPQHIDT